MKGVIINANLNKFAIIFLSEDRSNLFFIKVATKYTLDIKAIIEFIKVKANRTFTSQINSLGMFIIKFKKTISIIATTAITIAKNKLA